MKIVATIEARTGSTRLPKKVLKPILGDPMLSRIVERVKRCQSLDEITLATTMLESDTVLALLAQDLGIECFRGSEEDILERLAGAVEKTNADVLVSLTGDNPFVDPVLIDDMIDFLQSNNVDYVATTHMQHAENWDAERTFPRGVSVQVLYADLVREQHELLKDSGIRALGLYSIYSQLNKEYKLAAFETSNKYREWRHPELRLTVDTPEDFLLATRVYECLYPGNPHFSTLDAIRLILSNPDLQNINANIHQKIAYEEILSK